MASVDGLEGVFDFIKPLQPKIQAQIARKIFALSADPHPSDSAKLQGYDDLLRVDCGEYRIVYRYNDSRDCVEIIIVDKRNDDEVYKRLKRKLG